MDEEEITKRRRYRVFLIPFLERLLKIRNFSIINIINRKRGQRLKRYRNVEIWVLSWLIFEELWIIVFLVCPDLYWFCALKCFILVLLSYRLIDIFFAWLAIFVVQEEVRPLSPPRTLVLSLIGYVEIVFIFTVIAFLFGNHFNPQLYCIQQSLRYSVGVATTSGSPFEPIGVGHLLFYGELSFVALFALVIIVRVLSLFRERN